MMIPSRSRQPMELQQESRVNIMKVYAVISHTHWDREWYAPLEVFRLKLVDLIDRCLITLKKYPEYIFHLDAQTVVLDDYLAFRPDKEAELRYFITEGRLIVGPWYVQNDFYLTSGEATVRNLLEGRRIAQRFGRCAKRGILCRSVRIDLTAAADSAGLRH